MDARIRIEHLEDSSSKIPCCAAIWKGGMPWWRLTECNIGQIYQGFARTVDNLLYNMDRTRPSFNFCRVSQILDRLDGKTRFGLRFIRSRECWLKKYSMAALKHSWRHNKGYLKDNNLKEAPIPPQPLATPSTPPRSLPIPTAATAPWTTPLLLLLLLLLLLSATGLHSTLLLLLLLLLLCLFLLTFLFLLGRPTRRSDVGGALRLGGGPVRLVGGAG